MAIDLGVILEKANQVGASDVILTAGLPPVLRVGGEMRRVGDDKLAVNEIRELVNGMLQRDQIARFERERELDFSITYDQRLRFRGNAFWQRGAPGAVLRLIPTKSPALEELGTPPVVEEFAALRQGLVLVTGATGQGKSTTLAALIDAVNRTRNAHIITIEDPIEFLHQNRRSVIEQRELGLDTLSFAAALRHALRQAPDVILVGELRDLETIATALTAAETGHLVFATLHTNDALQTIDRLIDVFPPHQQNQVRAQLAAVLQAVVAQLLLPSVEGRRRVLACEIMRATPAVANLIREGKTHQIASVIDTQAKLGMVSLDTAIKRLYLEGRIAEDTARRAMTNPGILFG